MKTLLLMFLAISVISFSGCSPKECIPKEPDIIIEYQYIERPIPKIQDKPEFEEYQVILVNFNGEDYYALTRVNGEIMKNNWIVYREWSESNYKILKSLENNNSQKLKD